MGYQNRAIEAILSRQNLADRCVLSLAGRYFLFRINPLMLAEVNQASLTDLLPEPTAVGLIKKMLSHSRENVESFAK